MKLRRILATLLLALLAVGVAHPSAYAGGPTSVLMSNPDRQRAAAAYYSDSVYQDLTAGIGEGQAGPNAAPAGLTAGGGEDVRLTWLIHDVQIWRIDRIHLTSADGMWIETVADVGEGNIWDAPAHWHRPADEAALLAALSSAGMLGDTGPAPTQAPAAATEATVPTSAAPLPGLAVAALAGLAVGVAGTLVGVRARARTAADPRVTLSG